MPRLSPYAFEPARPVSRGTKVSLYMLYMVYFCFCQAVSVVKFEKIAKMEIFIKNLNYWAFAYKIMWSEFIIKGN